MSRSGSRVAQSLFTHSYDDDGRLERCSELWFAIWSAIVLAGLATIPSHSKGKPVVTPAL
jgi:hypothetical protein